MGDLEFAASKELVQLANGLGIDHVKIGTCTCASATRRSTTSRGTTSGRTASSTTTTTTTTAHTHDIGYDVLR